MAELEIHEAKKPRIAPHASVITDGVGEMGETKWTFHETPFFGRWRPRLVGRVRGTEGQAASGPAKPPLRASSGHATGGDALTTWILLLQ